MVNLLSSSFTFIFKFFPYFWISLLGGNTLYLHLIDNPNKWVFLVFFAISSPYVAYPALIVKKVSIANSCLVISNCFSEFTVPLTQVENISKLKLTNIPIIKIRFNEKNQFGMSIFFVPRMTFSSYLKKHPIVMEIEEAVIKAKTLT